MATYVLIHGASSDAWHWHLVKPMLEQLGHTVIAPSLPVSDDNAGLVQYADIVVDATADCVDSDTGGGHTKVIVVAQSLGGFVVPLVCDLINVDLVVLVAAMIPAPHEAPGDWWANTGYQASEDFDAKEIFFHDVPESVRDEAFARGEVMQSSTPFSAPYPFIEWPDVPTHFLLCLYDRFFPADFLRPIVKGRLGITPDEIESGHLPALAHPAALVERLEIYREMI